MDTRLKMKDLAGKKPTFQRDQTAKTNDKTNLTVGFAGDSAQSIHDNLSSIDERREA